MADLMVVSLVVSMAYLKAVLMVDSKAELTVGYSAVGMALM